MDELSPVHCQSFCVRGELGTCVSVQLTFSWCVSLIYVEYLVVVRDLSDTSETIDFKQGVMQCICS